MGVCEVKKRGEKGRKREKSLRRHVCDEGRPDHFYSWDRADVSDDLRREKLAKAGTSEISFRFIEGAMERHGR